MNRPRPLDEQRVIEGLWRSLNYLKGYADGREARLGIGVWIDFYNCRRPHQALGYATPMAVWCDGVVDAVAAQAVEMMDNARAVPTCPTAATTTADNSRQQQTTADNSRQQQTTALAA